MLHAIPDGAHCFVDANVICYHVINVPPLSLECKAFFNRLQTKQILAATSTALVTEAIHKVMLAEAVQKHGLDHRGLAHRLQRQRNLIADLEEHHKVPAYYEPQKSMWSRSASRPLNALASFLKSTSS